MQLKHPLIRRLGSAAGVVMIMLGALALGGADAGAAAPPVLEPLRVAARGQEATVEVAASEAVTITHSLRESGASMLAQGNQSPASNTFALPGASRPATRPDGGVFTPPSGPAGGVNAPVNDWLYQPRHSLKLTGLKSNTTYTLTVVATNRAGEKATAEAVFTTMKKRVRVTLDSIQIHSDGDLAGNGEPTWFWTVGYPVISIRDCFPAAASKCKEGSFGSGTIVPTTSAGAKFAHVFAEENFRPLGGGEDYTTMPTDFVLKAKAVESDGGLGWLDDFLNAIDLDFFGPGSPQASWTAPQGVETATQTVLLKARDGAFESTMTFRFDLFHDNASFPPNDGRVHSTSK